MVSADYIWETQLGIETPYGFDAEAYDDDAFDSVSEWTDISEDVRTATPPTWERGMSSGSPDDRVARVGVLRLIMNNFPKATPSLLGYYTPGHTNLRDGFGIGHGFRLRIQYAELSPVRFVGTIESATPVPGEALSRHVDVTVTDWMEEAATSQVEGLSTMLDARSDKVFTALVDSMPRPPLGVEVDEGLDTYAYALDTARDEGGSVLQELYKLAMSELAYIYLKADGTLVYQNRSARGLAAPENVYTFEYDLQDLVVRSSRADLINRIKVNTNPRRRDSSIVILYQLSQSVAIASGQTLAMRVSYTDPDQRSRRVGAVNIQTPLVQDVDYVGNSAEDGSGSYATFLLSVNVDADSNGADVLVTNTGGGTVWLTKLQIRGQGLYAFEPVASTAQNDDSIAQFGRRTKVFDMPYQSDTLVGASAAQFFLNLFSGEQSFVDSLTFTANKSDAVMRAALGLEISQRIGIRESVTGVTDAIAGSSATRGWFINGERGEIVSGKYLRVTYILTPTDVSTYWRLGVVGSTELGVTTKLGFGLFSS